jgi:acetyl-CoA carboxylase carboxyltransferase component
VTTDQVPAQTADERVTLLLEDRARLQNDLGGRDKVARLRAAGDLNARERVSLLLDPGSLVEIGMHARSQRPEDIASTPGDGKIGGYGTVRGRRVAVVADDITVKSGTSSRTGGMKVERIYQQAVRAKTPFVFLGQCGGGRIPDILPSSEFAKLAALPVYGVRRRQIPSITVIDGDSYGSSSFQAALSDLIIQVRGSCMAVTSPRVIKAAIGEDVTPEDLGGADVGSSVSGQVDVVADTTEDGISLAAQLLSYLPDSCEALPPRSEPLDPEWSGPLTRMVTTNRRRAYNMRNVLRHIVDDGSLTVIGEGRSRAVVTGLARLGGYPVGIVASQPMYQAGAFGASGCDAIARFVVLCDSFNLPLVFLQDTPGLLVGSVEEHSRLLFKGMLLQQAIVNATVPKLTVVLRKAYGLAHHLMMGCNMGADYLCAWPGAEFGFMDPEVGASVLYGRELADLDEEDRGAALIQRANELRTNTDVEGPARVMEIDDIIAPDETRTVLLGQLERLVGASRATDYEHRLANWPTCW